MPSRKKPDSLAEYRFDADGRVTTVTGNPFAASIEKMSADSLVKKVRKLAG